MKALLIFALAAALGGCAIVPLDPYGPGWRQHQRHHPHDDRRGWR